MTNNNAAGYQISYKKLSIQSSYLALSSVISTGLNLVVGFTLVRIMIPEQYGEVAFFLRLFGLVRFIGTLSLGIKVIEDISRFSTLQDRPSLRQAMSTLGFLRLASGLVILSVMLFLGWLWKDPIYTWTGLAGFVASISDFASAVAQGLKLRKEVALLLVTQPALFFGGVLSLTYSQNTTPLGVYVIFSTSFLIVLVLYSLMLTKTSLPIPGIKSLSWSYFIKAFKALSGMFLFGIFNYLYFSLGALILGQAKLFEEVAYFNSAISLVVLPITLGMTVLTAIYYPDVVSAIAAGQQDVAVRLVEIFIKVGVLLLSIPTAFLMVHADHVIRILYTDVYSPSIIPLIIMTPLTLLLLIQQLFVFSLFALKKLFVPSIGVGIQALVLFLGAMLLLASGQETRVIGMAVIYLATGVFGFVYCWIHVKRYFSFKVSVWEVGSIVIVVAAMLIGRLIVLWLSGPSFSVFYLLSAFISGLAGFWLVSKLVLKKSERENIVSVVRKQFTT